MRDAWQHSQPNVDVCFDLLIKNQVILENKLDAQATQHMSKSNFHEAEYIYRWISQSSGKEFGGTNDEFSPVLPKMVEIYKIMGNLLAAETYQENLLLRNVKIMSNPELLEEINELLHLYTLFYLRTQNLEFSHNSQIAELARLVVFRRASFLQISELDDKIINNADIGLPLLPLHEAVQVDALNMTSKLLASGKCNINAQDGAGFSPVHVALHCRAMKMLKLLVEEGADIEVRTNIGRSALLFAAAERLPESVEVLLNAGALLESRCTEGKTALHYAVCNRDEKSVKVLLGRGADSSAKDHHQKSPLMIVSASEESDMLAISEQLLEAGAKDEDGMTPFLLAAASGTPTMVEFMIEKGADISVRDENRRTALHIAVSRNVTDDHQLDNQKKIILVLIRSHVDIEAMTRCDETALRVAIRHGSQQSVELLLAHGADPDREDEWRFSPLFFAVRENHDGIVKLLLENGTKIDFVPGCDTMLNRSIRYSNSTIAKMLLGAGADPNAMGFNGNTALHQTLLCPIEQDRYQFFTMVLEHVDVDICAQNNKGDTPLHLATLSCRILLLLTAKDWHATCRSLRTVNHQGFTPIDLMDIKIRKCHANESGELIRLRSIMEFNLKPLTFD